MAPTRTALGGSDSASEQHSAASDDVDRFAARGCTGALAQWGTA